MPDGTYLGIEVKTGNAVQNKNQKKFMNKIRSNFGLYLVVRRIEDLEELFK